MEELRPEPGFALHAPLFIAHDRRHHLQHVHRHDRDRDRRRGSTDVGAGAQDTTMVAAAFEAYDSGLRIPLEALQSLLG